MATRFLYVARHGMADAFGELTEVGNRQASLLGQRLADVPVDAIWHSPLPRAGASAQTLASHLPDVPVGEAAELVDHVPYVPSATEMPLPWAGFFDGYDQIEAASGLHLAEKLVARFAQTVDPAEGAQREAGPETHEVLVTHAYPIAWLVRDALGAAPQRWLSLTAIANTALTIIEYRDDLAPTLVMFNDMSHLPKELRWTGFPTSGRP
jgi:serine/threonine-protein phosphatase PGAM5